MTQQEIIQSMLIEVNGLITEATCAGDRLQANQLVQRREALLMHLRAWDVEHNMRVA